MTGIGKRHIAFMTKAKMVKIVRLDTGHRFSRFMYAGWLFEKRANVARYIHTGWMERRRSW